MSTFFGNIKPFQILPEDGKILTEHFLETSRQCSTMFDMFGTGFIPLKSDMSGNIEDLMKKYRTGPDKYVTLDGLLENDDYTGKNAGQSALWLKRALEFIAMFLCNITYDYRSNTHSKSLVAMATLAYEGTLKTYHGWFTQKAFTFMSQFAPYTESFLKALADGKENMNEQVIKDIEAYQPLLKENVAALDALIKRYGHDNPAKV